MKHPARLNFRYVLVLVFLAMMIQSPNSGCVTKSPLVSFAISDASMESSANWREHHNAAYDFSCSHHVIGCHKSLAVLSNWNSVDFIQKQIDLLSRFYTAVLHEFPPRLILKTFQYANSFALQDFSPQAFAIQKYTVILI